MTECGSTCSEPTWSTIGMGWNKESQVTVYHKPTIYLSLGYSTQFRPITWSTAMKVIKQTFLHLTAIFFWLHTEWRSQRNPQWPGPAKMPKSGQRQFLWSEFGLLQRSIWNMFPSCGTIWRRIIFKDLPGLVPLGRRSICSKKTSNNFVSYWADHWYSPSPQPAGCHLSLPRHRLQSVHSSAWWLGLMT